MRKRACSPVPHEIRTKGNVELRAVPMPVRVLRDTYTIQTSDEEADSGYDTDETESSESDYMSDAEVIEDTIFQLSGPYSFVSRIHGHRNSIVYKAVENETNSLVAVKIKPRVFDNDPMEVRALSKLGDVERCQQLLAYYRLEFSMVVVSPLYKEHSMRKTIWNNADNIKIYMRHLLTTLRDIHSRGVIHRDLKPSNVMWDSDSKVAVLVDFDISTFKGKNGHTVYAGTDGFEAPEILAISNSDEDERRLTYDEKVDIYSAGVILGQFLFKCCETSVSHKAIGRWKKKCRTRANGDLVESLFLQLTLNDPNKRPSAESALAHSFFSLPVIETGPTSRVHHATTPVQGEGEYRQFNNST